MRPVSTRSWFIMLATLVWALLLSVQMQPYHKAQTLPGTCETAKECKYTAPIATLELATDPASFQRCIDQGEATANRDANVKLARVNTYMDLLFILLYWSVFVMLATTFPSRLSKWVIVAITLTAVFDFIEDALLLYALKAVGHHSSAFLAPGWDSHLKWSCLAAASLLLGLSFISQKGWTLLSIGIPMLLSALFTFWGQFSFPILSLGTLLLAVALLAALLLGYPFRPSKDIRLQWLNYLYFIRFSLLLWLVMPTLALLDARKITSAVTLGILTPETWRQLFFCSFFIVASGWLALTLARIVCAYGQERFHTPPPVQFTIGRTMRWSTFLLAQIPGLSLILRVAVNALVEGDVPPFTLAGSLLAGAVAAFAFWVVVAILYYWTYQPSFISSDSKAQTTARAFLIPDSRLLQLDKMEVLRNPPAAEFIRKVLLCFAAYGEGYNRPGPGGPRLHSGHSIALFLFFGYFVLYIGLMGITSPRRLPIVEHLTQALVIVIVAVAALNYVLGLRARAVEEQEAPAAAPGSRWYRFLSWAAVIVQLIFAVVIFLQPRSDRAFPVVASVFVLFTFATLTFAGLAFWADRYRIPVVTLAIVLITLTNLRPLRADHQFDALDLQQKPIPPTPDQVLQSMEPDGKVRPLIIVTATGGGIHAAMWTAEVLSLLERRFPQTSASGTYGFHDSILLASTVSGGSVGMMNFLREYNAPHPFVAATLDDHLVSSAACSSLEAVAWGLIYPDLARFVFPGFFRWKILPARYDRGLALEQAIDSNLTDASCNPHFKRDNTAYDPALSRLLPGRAGSTQFFPAFTLNTTTTETGDRYLLSNYQVQRNDDKYCLSNPTNLHSDILPAESFLQSYAEPCSSDTPKQPLADLRLSTAARLSASFTYVSPAARIESRFARYAYHFVDGGYFDNDGTGSVLEFLQTIALARKLPAGHIQPILLIEIRNGGDVYSDRSPDSYNCQLANCTAPSSTPTPWGPWRQLAAPAQAMYLAGHESITRRNRRELCLLETTLAPRTGQSNQTSGVAIRHIVFPIDDSDAALSWHLTSKQQAFIRSAPRAEKCDLGKGSDPSDSQTCKSLKDAVSWFSAAQQHPDTPPTTEPCRVYPE